MMNITTLVFNFSGNWAMTPINVPINDIAFGKTLFDDPLNTNLANPTNTLIINRSKGTDLTDLVSVNSQQLQIVTNDINLLPSTIQKLKTKFIELNPEKFEFSFFISSLGVDLELNEIPTQGSTYLFNKFFENKFSVIKEFGDNPAVHDIVFEFKTSPSVRYTIQIQPRVNAKNKLFVKGTQNLIMKTDSNFISSIKENLETFIQVLSEQLNQMFYA